MIATAATVGVTAVAAPAPVEARGWYGPGIAGGLVAGAVIGGIAANAWGYGPRYGYGPGYGYYGYAPAYAYVPAYPIVRRTYVYGPGYYGGYGPGYYDGW